MLLFKPKLNISEFESLARTLYKLAYLLLLIIVQLICTVNSAYQLKHKQPWTIRLNSVKMVVTIQDQARSLEAHKVDTMPPIA